MTNLLLLLLVPLELLSFLELLAGCDFPFDFDDGGFFSAALLEDDLSFSFTPLATSSLFLPLADLEFDSGVSAVLELETDELLLLLLLLVVDEIANCQIRKAVG